MTITAGEMSEPGRRPTRAETSRRAYRAAARHTRLVRLLRFAIPLGAVLSFAGFIVYPFIDPFRSAGISVGAVKMDGTRITMENPRLAGHRQGNRPYEVTAQSATQDIRVPSIIEMNQMRATLVNPDNGVMTISAETAVFDSQKERMRLNQSVRVRTQAGQEALLSSADIDFKAGSVISREPVEIRFPDMGVTAQSLDITDHGGKIAFVGRVSATVDDRDTAAAKAAAQPAASPPRSPPRAVPISGQPGSPRTSP